MSEPSTIHDLPTPSLIVERSVFDANVAAMSAALPGILQKGAGAAVVFLHGIGGAAAAWRPQVEVLGEDYQAIAWDPTNDRYLVGIARSAREIRVLRVPSVPSD